MLSERPKRILPVIVVSQFLATSLWFAGNAVLPDLRHAWNLGDQAVGAITSAVQLGFIVGTLVFAVFNVSDRYSPRAVFLACALLGAAANASIGLASQTTYAYEGLIGLRFATGFFLAGIYPVGMRIAAGWYRHGLGSALGYLVGALVLGTAFPHLLRGLGQALPWFTVLLWVSTFAALAGVLMFAFVPDGPHLSSGSAFDPRALAAIVRVPELRASAFGYFGHMWELYTLWALTPLLLSAHALMHTAQYNVSIASFVVIASGAVGCIVGGIASRFFGSGRVAFGQLALSGTCCFISPLAFALPPPAFLAFMCAWGIFVVGDSPQFSALTAANAPKAFVGSVLTMVNCVGFAITVVSIQLTAWLATRVPTELLFVPVAIGPLLGLFACRRLAFPLNRSGVQAR